MRGSSKTKTKRMLKNYLRNKPEKYHAESIILGTKEDDFFVAQIFACPETATDFEDKMKRGYKLKKIMKKTEKGIHSAAKKAVETFQRKIEKAYAELSITINPEELSECVTELLINRTDDRHMLYTKLEDIVGNLIKKFGYENVLNQIKQIPNRVNTVSWATNYTKKLLKIKEENGIILRKDIKKRDLNFDDIL